MTRTRSSFRWWTWLGLGLVLLVLAALAWLSSPSASGIRYGIGAILRSDADYDTLEAERSATPRAEETEAVSGPAPYWTKYRGPRGDGVYDERSLSLEWPEGGPPELWRVAVGPAYSSTVVAGGLAITMEQRRELEVVVAFGAQSGELVWEHFWPARFYESLSREGPRGTPAVAGDSVFAFGATGELRCLDLRTGELRWNRDLLQGGELPNLRYGLSSSPCIAADLVIVQTARAVSAHDLATGEQRWNALSEKLAYATPVLDEVLGRETLIVSSSNRIVGRSPTTGEELWSFPWEVSNGLSNTQPVVVAANRILVSAGYGKGSQLVELTRAADEAEVEVEVLWRSGRFKTRFNEPVLHGDHVYGLDEGILACIPVATGRRTWKEGRYGYGQLLVVQDQLLLTDEEGYVRVLAADPGQRRELRSFRALDGGVTLNLPALAHGLLYVRNDSELACFDLRGGP